MPSRFQSLPKELSRLSESEIQDRLYGKYQGKRKKFAPPAKTAPVEMAPLGILHPKAAQPSDSPQGLPNYEWTGLEILTGELIQLRSELLHLKDERERLTLRLDRLKRFQRSVLSLRQIFAVMIRGLFRGVIRFLDQVDRWWSGFLHQDSDLLVRPSARRLVRLSALAILIVLVVYPIGVGLLQASPSGREPTPYTIQVAVYDMKSYADRALLHLRGLGYPAYLREFLRLNGKPRYRLYVGSFVTKEEAQLQWKTLASDQHFEDFNDTFVRFY